jgi:hypothetical protein
VINMQLLDGVLMALAVLAGAAIVLSVVMVAAASALQPGQSPHGGIRRHLPSQPQPQPQPQPDTDDARTLVLR